MVSLSPRHRISPLICSQELSWPDDCGQWKLSSVLHGKLLATLKWLINSPVWRKDDGAPIVVLEQKWATVSDDVTYNGNTRLMKATINSFNRKLCAMSIMST